MITTTIGFIGIEVVDTIMYYSNICKHLGKRVIVMDYSDEEAFEYYIPVHNEIDMAKDCVSYDGVDFTKRRLSIEEETKYDVALVYTDYQKKPSSFTEYTHLIISTDMSKSSFKRILEIEIPPCEKKILTVRNVIGGSVNINPYIRETLAYLDAKDCYLHKLHLADLQALYKCQYNDRYNFKSVSKMMEDYLYKLIDMVYPEMDSKTVRNAVKKARKGA